MTETAPASARGDTAAGFVSAAARSADLLARTFAQRRRTLIRTVRTHHPKGDVAIIERAYQVAAQAHASQKRQSGEPYITHPLAVAQILADLGLGPRAIAAALLHDTVEDTDYRLDQLTADFGDEVAMLVDGVTKLDKVKYGDAAQARPSAR
jgi:GTP pyrophosphokinase